MDERTIARFWAKVDKSAGPDGCWLWTASKNVHGYGKVRTPSSPHAGAHRVSWELAHGQIPPGEGAHGTCVLHRCDVRACVNPAHLFLGTVRDNTADKVAKGRHPRGESSTSAKLTSAQIVAIFADRSAGASQRRLAAAYGISQMTVWRILAGRRF